MDRVMEWYRARGRLQKIIIWLAAIFVALIILGSLTAPPAEETETQSSQTGTQSSEQQQQALSDAEEEARKARAEADAARAEAEDLRQQLEEERAAREEAENAQAAAEDEAQAAQDEAQSAQDSEQNSSPPPDDQASQDGGSSTATIRVTGGIPFSGSYGNIDTTQSVDGNAPTEYEVEYDSGFLSVDSVTAVMQKTGAGGTLGVQIIVDGEVVKETETSAEYGVAQVNWTPGE